MLRLAAEAKERAERAKERAESNNTKHGIAKVICRNELRKLLFLRQNQKKDMESPSEIPFNKHVS